MRHARAISGLIAVAALSAALAGCQADSAPKYYLKPKDPDAASVQRMEQQRNQAAPGASGAPPPPGNPFGTSR